MSEQMKQHITEADVRSLTEKLARFCETLTPAEYTVLGAVVQRAASTVDDAQGYGGIKIDVYFSGLTPASFSIPGAVGAVAPDALKSGSGSGSA